MELNDETIMAYADDELDETDREKVRLLLKQDPEAQEKLKLYQASKQRLHEEFSYLREDIPPQMLLDTVHKHFSKKNNNVIQLFPVRQLQTLAATLVIGFFVGVLFMKFTDEPNEALLFDQSPKQVFSTSEKPPISSKKIDESDHLRLLIVHALGKQLAMSPDRETFEITLNSKKYLFNVEATFKDTRNSPCKILKTDDLEVRYMAACMKQGSVWEIKIED